VSSKTLKWGKMAVILAVLTLFCFMFGGAALAAGEQWTITPDVVKAMHTYDYTITGSNLYADLNQFCDTDPANPQHQLYIDFPFCNSIDCFNQTPYPTFQLDNGALEVKVDLTVNGQVFHLNAIAHNAPFNGEPPTILEDFQLPNGNCVSRLALTIERQNISVTGKVTNIVISGIKVKNPPKPKADYCVSVKHQQDCFSPSNCMNLNVVRTVGAIDFNADKSCLVSGTMINFNGQVLDTECNGWGQASWPVIIGYMEGAEIQNPKPCDLCPDVINIWDCADVDNPYAISVEQEVNCVTPPGPAGVLATPIPGMDNYIKPIVTHTDGNGNFQGSIMAPLAGTYNLVARTIEVADTNLDNFIQYTLTTTADNVPYEAIEDFAYAQGSSATHYLKGKFDCGPETYEHAWLLSDPSVIVPLTSNPRFLELGLNRGTTQVECNAFPVTVCLLDKFGQPTENKKPCGGNYPDLKVELNAYNYPDGTLNGGYFIDENGSKINYIYIPGGEQCATARFQPVGGGVISVQASAIIRIDPNDPSSGVSRIVKICPLEINCEACLLEVTPLVECDNIGLPRAGWPVKVSVHYDPTLAGTVLADPARTTANIRVELLDVQTRDIVAAASWDTIAKTTANKLDYNAVGGNASGATFAHPNLSGYVNKSDIYVYVPADYCGSLVVKIVDADKHIKDEGIIFYVSPVELKRVLKPNSWQLISTPKQLAGTGSMSSLIGDNSFSEMFIYDKNQPNGPWVQVTDPNYRLLPQYGYLLNMKQNFSGNDLCPGNCGSENCIIANYVFARATSPFGITPSARPLPIGWSMVAPAFEADPDPDLKTRYNYYYFCDAFGNCDCGNLLLTQGDTLSRMLGSACSDCKVIKNWGGKGLNVTNNGGRVKIEGTANAMGNLGTFVGASISQGTLQSWANDPQNYAFNGDAYWLYLTSPQSLAPLNELEIVDVTP